MLPKYLTYNQVITLYKDLLLYMSTAEIQKKSEKDFLEKFLAGHYIQQPHEIFEQIRYESWRRNNNNENFLWVLTKRAAFLKNDKKLFLRYDPKVTPADKYYLREAKTKLDAIADRDLREIIELNDDFLKNSVQ